MSTRPRKGRVPNSTELSKIKTSLCMGRNEPFLKCAARDMAKVRRFEEEGDWTHSEALHCCDLCRCDKTAGLHTSDDFYDIEGVGHYGVGFCWEHERGRRRHTALVFARTQMKALQSHSRAMAQNARYKEMTSEDLAIERCGGMPVSELNRIEQVRSARDSVFSALSEMQRIMQDGNLKCTQEILNELEDIKSLICESEVVDGTAVLLRINEIFKHDVVYTEKCGASVIPMTDSTKIDKLRDLAMAVSKIGLDDFRMTEKDYVEKRAVAMKLKQTFADMGKELAMEFGDDTANRIKQNLADRVFLPIWGDM